VTVEEAKSWPVVQSDEEVAAESVPKVELQVNGSAPPAEVASLLSQRPELPVRAIQVASRLPKFTTPFVSIASAAVVEVA
jgi:hypothetical protein